MRTAFNVTVRINLEGHDDKAHLVSTDLALKLEGPLKTEMYLDPNNMPTEDGMRAVTQTLVMGLVSNIHRMHEEKTWDSAAHLRKIIAELERGFVALSRVELLQVKGKVMHDHDINLQLPMDIQKAHDMLRGLVNGELSRVSAKYSAATLRQAERQLEVLCWVLCHKHENLFRSNIEQLEKDIAAEGYNIIFVEPKEKTK